MIKVLTIVFILSLPSIGWTINYTISNLTGEVVNDASQPSLNDNGQIAWTQSMFLPSWGGYGDVFLDGINITNLASKYKIPYSSGAPSLNNNGNISWIQQPQGGKNDVFHNGINLTANIAGDASLPTLNDNEQIVWWQRQGDYEHIFLDEVDLTPGFLGLAQYPTINNKGQIAYVIHGRDIILDGIHVYQGVTSNASWLNLNDAGQISWMSMGGEYDVFLDGINMTNNVLGDAMKPILNDNGQLVYELYTGSEWDIILDGINLTENIFGDARDPSLNNMGQVAWTQNYMGHLEIFMASPNPVPEPATIILLGTGLLGLVGASRKKFKKK